MLLSSENLSIIEGIKEYKEEALQMKIALLIGVILVFFTSFFTSGYEAKPGTPRKQ